MDPSLRSRLKKGLSAQAFGRTASVVIQLATVPLLITVWGVDVFGAWLILTAIPAYLALSDLGFASAAQNEMTMAVARGDRGAALEAFQSTWILVLALSLAVVLILGGLASLAPLADWLHLSVLSSETILLILWLLGLHVLLSIQCALIYAGFHSEGSYGLGQFLLAGVRLLEFALLAIAVLMGGGPGAAAGGWLVGRVIGTIAMRLVLRRVSPSIVFGWSHARKATVRKLARPALASLAFPLANAMNIQGIVIIVGALFSPAMVVAFATLRTMTRFGTQLVGAVCVNVAPEISTAFGAGNSERVRKLHDHACQVALWVAAAVIFGLAVFGEWLLDIWTTGLIDLRWDIFALFLAILAVNALSLASLMLVYATNRHMRVAAVYVIVNAAALGAAYLLGQWVGLTGVAASILIAELIVVAYVITGSLRLLDETLVQFGQTVLQPPFPLVWRFLQTK